MRALIAQDQPALSIPVRLGNVEGVIHVRWEPTPRLIQVVVPVPLQARPDQLASAALELARINHRLSMPGFLLNPDTGSIVFRTQGVLDHDGSISLATLRSVMNTALETTAAWLPKLAEVAGVTLG